MYRWPLAKTRGPQCNNLWSSLLLRTLTAQSSFRNRYLHSTPSHLSSAHYSVCSSSRVQFFIRKPAILHEGVGGVRPFLLANSGTLFRTTIAWSRRSLLSKCQTVCRYTPRCNVWPTTQKAVRTFLHGFSRSLHCSIALLAKGLYRISPKLDNMKITSRNSCAPVRKERHHNDSHDTHACSTQFCTEILHRIWQESDKRFRRSLPTVDISQNTNKLYFTVLIFGVEFVFWLIPSSYNELLNTWSKRHTSKLFCHRYLGRRGTAGCCLHTRRIFGYRRNARDCSTPITTNQHVLPPDRNVQASGRAFLLRTICLSVCLSVCLFVCRLTPAVSTVTDRSATKHNYFPLPSDVSFTKTSTLIKGNRLSLFLSSLLRAQSPLKSLLLLLLLLTAKPSQIIIIIIIITNSKALSNYYYYHHHH